jgi:hypothetical protein
MKVCKMLNTSRPDHQTMCLFTKSCVLCSNVYSLGAHSFDKNAVLSFWNIIINFFLYKRRTKNVVRVLYEFRILKTRRRSTGKMLAGQTFCRVCLYLKICRSIPSTHLTTIIVVHLYANFILYKGLSVGS